jgi:hypothetical protein
MGLQVGAKARINFSIAALFVLAAVCWPFVQMGVNWHYGREAKTFINKIEEGEIRYKLIHNRYLHFGRNNSALQLKALDIDPEDGRDFDVAVVDKDPRTFFIIAQLRPHLLKRWYLNGTRTKLRYIYEKREGRSGRFVDSLVGEQDQ